MAEPTMQRPVPHFAQGSPMSAPRTPLQRVGSYVEWWQKVVAMRAPQAPPWRRQEQELRQAQGREWVLPPRELQERQRPPPLQVAAQPRPVAGTNGTWDNAYLFLTNAAGTTHETDDRMASGARWRSCPRDR